MFLFLKHEIKNVASLGSSILDSGLLSVRRVTWSWTVDLKVFIPATPWSQTPSHRPTPASHVSHQPWHRRLSWLWLCLSSLPCTGPQTFPAAFFRDALPDGSMDILAFLLSHCATNFASLLPLLIPQKQRLGKRANAEPDPAPQSELLPSS